MQLLDDHLTNILEISESDLKLEIAILLFQKDKISSEKQRKLREFPCWNFGNSFQKEILI